MHKTSQHLEQKYLLWQTKFKCVSERGATVVDGSAAQHSSRLARAVSPLRKPTRRRNKFHLIRRSRSGLVCQRSPRDAHHLRFAQPRKLGRKVSDEFSVPPCRDHHRVRGRARMVSCEQPSSIPTGAKIQRLLRRSRGVYAEAELDPIAINAEAGTFVMFDQLIHFAQNQCITLLREISVRR
jgi:hypothetical protein